MQNARGFSTCVWKRRYFATRIRRFPRQTPIRPMKRTPSNPSFSTTCATTSMKPTRSTGVSSMKKFRVDSRGVCSGMTHNAPISSRFSRYQFPAFFIQPQTSFESTLQALASQRNRAMAQNSSVAQRQFAIDLVGVSCSCDAAERDVPEFRQGVFGGSGAIFPFGARHVGICVAERRGQVVGGRSPAGAGGAEQGGEDDEGALCGIPAGM